MKDICCIKYFHAAFDILSYISIVIMKEIIFLIRLKAFVYLMGSGDKESRCTLYI